VEEVVHWVDDEQRGALRVEVNVGRRLRGNGHGRSPSVVSSCSGVRTTCVRGAWRSAVPDTCCRRSWRHAPCHPVVTQEDGHRGCQRARALQAPSAADHDLSGRTPRSASSRRSQTSLTAGNAGTARQSVAIGTCPTMAMVAAWSISPTCGPTNVAPTTSRRSWSRTSCAPAPRAGGDEGAAGDRARVVADDLDVEAGVPGLLLDEADGGDLGVGEDDLRHGGGVGAGGAVLAGDEVADQTGLVLALVGQQRSAVHVAGGVQPPAVDGGHAQPVVDLERPAQLEPDRLQPDVVGVGRPSGGDQQLAPDELAAVVEDERDGTPLGWSTSPRDPSRTRGRWRQLLARLPAPPGPPPSSPAHPDPRRGAALLTPAPCSRRQCPELVRGCRRARNRWTPAARFVTLCQQALQ
jgi:hypothetical protein